MEKALLVLKEKCQELGWPFAKVKADFLLFCEFSGIDPEKAVTEYVEETENQGPEW